MAEHIHVKFMLAGQEVAKLSGGPVQSTYTALAVLTGLVNDAAGAVSFDEIDVKLCGCDNPTGGAQ